MDNNLNQELENVNTEQSKAAVKEDAKGLWISLKTFIIELLDFRHDTGVKTFYMSNLGMASSLFLSMLKFRKLQKCFTLIK